RSAFWVISNPEVATPPAFDAFPGAYNIFAFWNTIIALLVEGILAPSLTQMHPFFTSNSASLSPSSFWVAHGRAISHLISQGFLSFINLAFGYFFTYSFILALSTFLRCIMYSSFSVSI